ncbi:ccaat-box DNA binding protein subunit B [Schistosoma japonicum]|nr:ccaat-box DNA binding protein subunit B [Schistosoma japonicum]
MIEQRIDIINKFIPFTFQLKNSSQNNTGYNADFSIKISPTSNLASLSSCITVIESNNKSNLSILTANSSCSAKSMPLEPNSEDISNYRSDMISPFCNQESKLKNTEQKTVSNKCKKRVTFLSPECSIKNNMSCELQTFHHEANSPEVSLQENRTTTTNQGQHEKNNMTFHFDSNIRTPVEFVDNTDENFLNYSATLNKNDVSTLLGDLSDTSKKLDFHQQNDQQETYAENRDKLRVQLKEVFNKVKNKSSDNLMLEKQNNNLLNSIYTDSEDSKQTDKLQNSENYPTCNTMPHMKSNDSSINRSLNNRDINISKSAHSQSKSLTVFSTHINKVVNELRELLRGTWPLKTSRIVDVQKFAYQKALQYRQEHGEISDYLNNQQEDPLMPSRKNVPFKEDVNLCFPSKNSILNVNSPLLTGIVNSKFPPLVNSSFGDNLSFENIKRSVERQLNNILRKPRNVNSLRPLSASSSPVKGLGRYLYPNEINFLKNCSINNNASSNENDFLSHKATNQNVGKNKPKHNVPIIFSPAVNHKSNESVCQSNNHIQSCLGLDKLDSHNMLDNTFNRSNSGLTITQKNTHQTQMVNISTSPINMIENAKFPTHEIRSEKPSQGLPREKRAQARFLEFKDSPCCTSVLKLNGAINKKIERDKSEHEYSVEHQKWNYPRKILNSSSDIDVDGFTDSCGDCRSHNTTLILNKPNVSLYSDRPSSFFDKIYVYKNKLPMSFKVKDRQRIFTDLSRSKTPPPYFSQDNFVSLNNNNTQIHPNESNRTLTFKLPRYFIESDLTYSKFVPADSMRSCNERYSPHYEDNLSSRLDTLNLSSRRYNQARWQTTM